MLLVQWQAYGAHAGFAPRLSTRTGFNFGSTYTCGILYCETTLWPVHSPAWRLGGRGGRGGLLESRRAGTRAGRGRTARKPLARRPGGIVPHS